MEEEAAKKAAEEDRKKRVSQSMLCFARWQSRLTRLTSVCLFLLLLSLFTRPSHLHVVSSCFSRSLAGPCLPSSLSLCLFIALHPWNGRKQVETLMVYQEKVDAIQKLETELALSKQAAIQASPATFGLGYSSSGGAGFGAGLFSPQLGLGAGGLAGLVQEGGKDQLAATQAKLAAWLQMNNPHLMQMSQERREYVLQYQQLEHQLVSRILMCTS